MKNFPPVCLILQPGPGRAKVGDFKRYDNDEQRFGPPAPRPFAFRCLLQLLLLFDTVIATVIAVASSNSTAASQDPACTRDPRHTHAAHGRGARRGNGPTVGGGGAERRRSERQGSSATSPRGGGACRGQGSAGCCARGEKRGRPHGQRAHKCAPAKPRRSAATPGGGDPSDADQEGQDDREADEDTRRRRP